MSFREDEGLADNEIVVDGEVWEIKPVPEIGNYYCESEKCDPPGSKEEDWKPAVVECYHYDPEGGCLKILCAECFKEWSGEDP